MNIHEIVADLLERGFFVTNDGTYSFAEGSIANYRKCSVSLGYRMWGDIAGEWFYSVRYESFMESGQPEIDHHTVSECYVAESNIAEFMRSKGIYTIAEWEAKRAERKMRKRG